MADAAKPKRRLPFKPTALRQKSNPKPAQKTDEEEDDGLALFQRSAEIFPIALADQQRRIKRKEAERERSSQAPSPGPDANLPSRTSEDAVKQHGDDAIDFDTPPPSKRSRTSDDSPHSATKASSSKSAGDETPSKRMTRAATSRTPRKQEPPPSKPVISIDDSDDDADDDDDIYGASPPQKPRRQTSEPEAEPSPLVIDDDVDEVDPFKSPEAEEEEDEDFREYIRQAKERKRALEQEKEAAHPPQQVTVFVTTEIPGASSKQFKFTVAKPLKVLRNAWINVMHSLVPLSQSELESVFLTWRGRTLYDWTTLHSLDLPGEYRKSTGDHDGFKEDWTKVHMEMWTKDLWEEHEKQAARQRRHDLGDFSDEEDAGEGAEAVGAEPEEQKIKVLLKTKTEEPLKTSVRPSTTIGTILELFRKMRGLAEDASVTLMFDGDELSEDMTVADADIDDMDTIEVYIR